MFPHLSALTRRSDVVLACISWIRRHLCYCCLIAAPRKSLTVNFCMKRTELLLLWRHYTSRYFFFTHIVQPSNHPAVLQDRVKHQLLDRIKCDQNLWSLRWWGKNQSGLECHRSLFGVSGPPHILANRKSGSRLTTLVLGRTDEIKRSEKRFLPIQRS